MGSTSADDEYVDYVTARLPALHRLAYVLSGDPHGADDIVQQAITTLYMKWSKIRRVDHLDRYVRSMIVNVFLDERRRAWSRVRLFAEPPEAIAPGAYDAEDRTVLRAALSRVPRRQQAVLVLRFFYDLPISEVAEILGISDGTVKSQTSHGLAALRRLLGERTVAALTKER